MVRKECAFLDNEDNQSQQGAPSWRSPGKPGAMPSDGGAEPGSGMVDPLHDVGAGILPRITTLERRVTMWLQHHERHMDQRQRKPINRFRQATMKNTRWLLDQQRKLMYISKRSRAILVTKQKFLELIMVKLKSVLLWLREKLKQLQRPLISIWKFLKPYVYDFLERSVKAVLDKLAQLVARLIASDIDIDQFNDPGL